MADNPINSIEGIYDVELSVETGPHQGLVTGANQFEVVVPDIDVSPASFSFNVGQGETDTDNMTINNTGAGLLRFQIFNSASSGLNADFSSALKITTSTHR